MQHLIALSKYHIINYYLSKNAISHLCKRREFTECCELCLPDRKKKRLSEKIESALLYSFTVLIIVISCSGKKNDHAVNVMFFAKDAGINYVFRN